jgi:hypothetical protein
MFTLYMSVFHWIIYNHMTVDNYWCFQWQPKLDSELVDKASVYLDNPYFVSRKPTSLFFFLFLPIVYVYYIYPTMSIHTNCKFTNRNKIKSRSNLFQWCLLSRPRYTSNSNFTVSVYYLSLCTCNKCNKYSR